MNPNAEIRLGVCPHCGARVSPLGLLRIDRGIPYECRACGGKAVINARSAMIVVAAYLVAVAIPVIVLEYAGAGAVELYALCLLAALPIPLVFARFCLLEPQAVTPSTISRSTFPWHSE